MPESHVRHERMKRRLLNEAKLLHDIGNPVGDRLREVVLALPVASLERL